MNPKPSLALTKFPDLLRSVAFFFLLGFCLHDAQASSALRVVCDGENAGAEISVNGAFKGQCPIDIQVNAGQIRLTAIKKSDPRRVGTFEQNIRIGDGVAQRIEVQLNMQLTPQGIQEEDAAINARQVAYDKAMALRVDRVRQCVEGRFDAASQRGSQCYTHSGGCVGGLFCETRAARNQRCYGSATGIPDRAPMEQACEREISAPPSPPPLSEAAKRRQALRAEAVKLEKALAIAREQEEKRAQFGKPLDAMRGKAAGGDVEAMYTLARKLEESSFEQDQAAAVQWYKQAVLAGHAAAHGRLGSLYFNGRLVPKDQQESLRLWRQGAALQDGRSFNGLGIHYVAGISVEKDPKEALQWFEKGAAVNNIYALTSLATNLLNGSLGFTDPARSFALFKRASGAEHEEQALRALAMNSVGFCYQHGQGTPADPVQAVLWYQKAADLGSVNAMFNLALAHASSYGGLAPNREKEIQLLKKAADGGQEAAKQRLQAYQ